MKIKEMKKMIKWTVYNDKKFPILVGEFQIAGKHDFTGRVGNKKIEATKNVMSRDLIKALEELLK